MGQAPPPDICFQGDTVPGGRRRLRRRHALQLQVERQLGARASARRTTSRATAGPSSSRASAASSPRSRTTWPPGPCRPTPASAAPTTSTRTSRIPFPTAWTAAGVTNHYLLAGAGASQDLRRTRSRAIQQEFLAGVEFAVGRNMNVGVRYIHRTIPRILEDYQPAAIAAYDLGCPGLGTVEYFINNISPSLPKFTCNSRRRLPDARLPGGLRGPGPQVRLGRVHGQQDVLRQLVADGVVSLVEAERPLRGRLPQRQRPVRPLDHVALRLPDQRPELHPDRRSRSSATAATSATRAAPWAAACCRTTGRTRSRSTASYAFSST